MGCCLTKRIKDKDQPLLSEHADSEKETTTNRAVVSIESTPIKNDEIEPKVVVKEPVAKKKKKKRSKEKKRDSKIDKKDLAKLNNFTERMKEKEEGVIVTLKIKSMDTNFPIFKVSIDQNLSVMELKNKIYEQSPDKIIALRQRLIYSGKLLKDSRTLKQYKISDAQTLMLVRSRRNQQSKKTLNVSSQNNAGTNWRSRAMTTGAPRMYQRSKTPQPEQISQAY